jgi:hypothetical protein
MKPIGIRWAGQMESIGETRNAYRDLVGKREANMPPSTTRLRWEYNIKEHLEETG